MTTDSYTGGCRCGALRYDIAAEPVFANHCQCLDCQHFSGTGHGSYLTFPSEAVAFTGEPRAVDVVADSGNTKHHGSCSTCGSPVTLTFAAMPNIFTVHAATFEDPTRFAPQVVTYASRGLPWDKLDPELTHFDTRFVG